MSRWWLLALGFLSVNGWALPEFSSIQERAQGQALAGSAVLNDSLYSNPASSAFTPAYSVEGIFALPRSFGVSILDTKNNALGGALGYFRKSSDGESFVQGGKFILCGKLSDSVALGVGGKTLWAPGRHMNDIDAGMLTNLGVFQLGFTSRNILKGSPQFDQPREWSMGGRFNYQNTFFASAASYSTWAAVKPYQVGFGVEYVSPYFFALKGGHRFQPGGPFKAWSAGFSFLAPKLGLHYAADFPNGGAKMEHTLGLTLLM